MPQWALFIIVILLLLRLGGAPKTSEGYDEKLPLSRSQCANFCKQTAGCVGFAYDAETATCYPSRIPLFGTAGNAWYQEEAQESQEQCNKINVIPEPMEEPAFELRRPNALFRCRKEGDRMNQGTMHLHNENQFQPLLNEESEITPDQLEKYSVLEYEWPSPETMMIEEARRRMLLFRMQRAEEINYEDPFLNVLSTEERENLKNQLENPEEPEPVDEEASPVQIIGSGNSHYPYGFTVEEKMIPDNYLYDFQCLSGSDLPDCLRGCQRDQECQAVEWNPAFLEAHVDCDGQLKYDLYRNVCCPKKTSEPLIERDERYRSGKTYLKNQEEGKNQENQVVGESYEVRIPDPLPQQN